MTRTLIYIIAAFALWLYFKYGNFDTVDTTSNFDRVDAINSTIQNDPLRESVNSQLDEFAQSYLSNQSTTTANRESTGAGRINTVNPFSSGRTNAGGGRYS